MGARAHRLCQARRWRRGRSARLRSGGDGPGRCSSEAVPEVERISPYLLMLRMCQGRVSPLDDVCRHTCPKPLLALAARCCSLAPEERPGLDDISSQLERPILLAVDSAAFAVGAGARRPTQPLAGWKEQAEAEAEASWPTSC